MKDLLGRELSVGDEIIYLQHYRTSSSLNRGIVTGFTPMKINIDSYSIDGRCRWCEQKYPRHVVKVVWSDIEN